MAINPNVARIASEDTITAYYTKKESEAGRISVVSDPVGQRGNVVRVYRHKDDPVVDSGLRQEIARDVFVSEYALNTGGGVYWTSYMLGPEWGQVGNLLDEQNPGTNYGIVIKQFHVRNIDPFTHPKISLVVTNKGVSVRNWGLSDASETTEADAYERAVTWPIDTMRWHDVVFGVKWSLDSGGQYAVWLDGVLVWRYHGQTIYTGASAGCWYSEGIYSPGGYPAGVDELTIYCQGYRQGTTGATSFNEVVGVNPSTPKAIGVRSVVSGRGALERSVLVRSLESGSFTFR